MTRCLSLHQLCALEAGPTELVDIAHRAGFDHLCIFVRGLDDRPSTSWPLLDAAGAPAFRARLDATGISVLNLEIFVLTPQVDVMDFAPALALGRSVGGRSATVVIRDDDEGRAADNLARFSELAAEFQIRVGLEFMAFSPVRTLADAVRLVRASGHDNAGITVDILHMVRNGVPMAALAALDPRLISYAQLCDGPLAHPPADLQRDEATRNRLPPGEGAFPLRDFLAALPAGQPVAVEVPLHDRRDQQGMGADARASLLMRRTRALLAEAA